MSAEEMPTDQLVASIGGAILIVLIIVASIWFEIKRKQGK